MLSPLRGVGLIEPPTQGFSVIMYTLYKSRLQCSFRSRVGVEEGFCCSVLNDTNSIKRLPNPIPRFMMIIDDALSFYKLCRRTLSATFHFNDIDSFSYYATDVYGDVVHANARPQLFRI